MSVSRRLAATAFVALLALACAPPPSEPLDAGLAPIVAPMPTAPTPADEGLPGVWEPLESLTPPARAFVVEPAAGGPIKPLLFVHSSWGLDTDERTLVRDLANAGFTVVAPDVYDGVTATSRLSQPELLAGVAGDRALAMLDAALTRLRRTAGANARVAIFSMRAGAPWAIRFAETDHQLAGLLVDTALPRGAQAPTAMVTAPVMLMVGVENASATEAVLAEISADFAGLGSSITIKKIPAAGTDLFDPKAIGFSDVGRAEAFREAVAYLDAVLAAP